MAVSAKDVKKLRDMTGVGMMDCKKALTETNGDFEAAVELLRKKGQKVSAKRADRKASEGAIFVHTNEEATEALLVAFNCETDFVAKNAEFVGLGEQILAKAIAEKPTSKEDLVALKLDERTITDHITDLVGKIGEKIEVSAYEVLQGEKIFSYIHNTGKLGVLVALENVGDADVSEAGNGIAMQIAAMKPLAVNRDGISQEIIDKELEIYRDQLIAEGKPEKMLDKIAQGKLNKFFKERTLLDQEYVRMSKTSVAKFLNGVQKGLTVSNFKRVEIA